MRHRISALFLLSASGCTGLLKEANEPDSRWEVPPWDATEVRWDARHAGTSANAYPYEDYVGLPYPDGRACEFVHHMNPPENQEEEESFYRLRSWKTRVGGSEVSGDYKLISAPVLVEHEIVDLCPARRGTRWSNDLVHGPTVFKDGEGRIDGWHAEAATTRGTHSQTANGFVGQLFAPYDAVLTTKFSFPDARTMAEDLVVNDQVIDLYDANPCQLHLKHYLADEWFSVEDLSVELSTDGLTVTFSPTTNIDSDLQSVYAKVNVEWGGNGEKFSAECSVLDEPNTPPLEEGEDGEAHRDYCESMCEARTINLEEYEECLEECDETGPVSTFSACEIDLEVIPSFGSCVPGRGTFMAVPSGTPSRAAANMLLPVEILTGNPTGASNVIDAPDHLMIHALLEDDSRDFRRSELRGSPFPLGLAYTDAEAGSLFEVAWDCSEALEAEPPSEPTWLVRDLYGEVDLLVTRTSIPSTNPDTGESESVPALRYQVRGRRDMVTVLHDTNYTLLGQEVSWTNNTLIFGGVAYSSERLF